MAVGPTHAFYLARCIVSQLGSRATVMPIILIGPDTLERKKSKRERERERGAPSEGEQKCIRIQNAIKM